MTETYTNTEANGPYDNDLTAYAASKALAYAASKTFVKENKPAFDVINIMPTFVIGRDDTVTAPSDIIKGTNGILMGPILGHAHPVPYKGSTVHLDDVAKMHVLSLDPKIEGNQDFLAVGPNDSSVNWADSYDIVKKHFPEQYKAGAFKFDDIPRTVTVPGRASNAKAAKAFGIKFKGFEDQVTSVVGHFLELTGQK